MFSAAWSIPYTAEGVLTPEYRNPHIVLVWAILHYLDVEAKSPDRKLFHLTSHLRSNWKVTKALAGYTLSKGWVTYETASKTYAITPAGRTCLFELRPVLERFYSAELGKFRRRLGEAVD